MKLRPYQQNLIDKIRDALDTHRMICVVLATGGGKSIIEASILKSVLNNGNSGWLLTHRMEIFRQLLQHLINQNISPGQILSGQKMTANKIQLAMIQTLYKKLKYVEKVFPDLLIHDEAHHGIAKTNNAILNFKESTKVIGFTATPTRTDGQGLNQAGYTCLIQGAQSQDLIDAGYLTQPVVFSSESTILFRQQKFKKKNNEYDQDEQSKFASEKAIVEDTVNVYKNYFNGNPCIIFCCSVGDCDITASALRGAGWKAESVYDGIDPELRRSYIEGLGNGKLNIVCSYDIISEGVDIPILSGIIIRRLTCSLINWMQWCGRALRRAPGKNHAIIIDQAGNIFNHGYPTIYREWSLEGAVKTVNEKNLVKQCPRCGAWIPSNVHICPYCNEDLSNRRPEKPQNIKIINSPLYEIKPPDNIQTGDNSLDIAQIMEYDESDFDEKILERLKYLRENKDSDIQDRLNFLCRAFGKSNKWMNETWRMINK